MLEALVVEPQKLSVVLDELFIRLDHSGILGDRGAGHVTFNPGSVIVLYI